MRPVARSFMVVLLLGGTVLAQQGGPAAPAQAQPTPEVKIPPIKQQAQLTSEEVRVQATDYLNQMQTILAQVLQLEDSAKRQQDIIRAGCVEDKARRIREAIEIAQKAMKAMQEYLPPG